MKLKAIFSLIGALLLVSCGSTGSDRVPVAELPDPAIYAIRLNELPKVGLDWQQSYNQTTTNEGFKWSYLAYQAYQPGNLGVDLESAFAVNNDVVLYEIDMRRADLPQPPQAMGNIQNITWTSASLSHRLGDKSAVWKTTVGELFTPIWWLGFYQGHAYVRISLLGFPDQIAPSILFELGDNLSVISYTAPPGDTGMVPFFDESGSQLTDGVYGSDDLLADMGFGTGYEWVGWTELTDPVTLTFTLADGADIGAVQVGINHREGLGVFVPDQVAINGTRFRLDAEAISDNHRGTLTFNGPFSGPVIEISLTHRGRGWIMVDELRFIPVK